MQIKKMHINKQNKVLSFINHVKDKFLKHINKIQHKDHFETNKTQVVDNTHKKKNVDHMALANLNSPLLKSKMMQFEQMLINSGHYHYNPSKKKDDTFKLVNYKTEILKKLRRGLKNINKTFEFSEDKKEKITRKNTKNSKNKKLDTDTLNLSYKSDKIQSDRSPLKMIKSKQTEESSLHNSVIEKNDKKHSHGHEIGAHLSTNYKTKITVDNLDLKTLDDNNLPLINKKISQDVASNDAY